MKILSLDLGTKTGFALLENGSVTSGTWLLATDKELREQKKAKRERCCEMRVEKLFKLVSQLMPADHVYFEDVQFCTSQAQAQLWASFRGAIMLAVCKPSCVVHAIPVGTLKKFATGKGNAQKDQMASALLQARPDFYAVGSGPKGEPQILDRVNMRPMDDNEVDALHLLNLARKELSC
jgi:Holliday junction resolvasome RuvABC endonuclease subunit